MSLNHVWGSYNADAVKQPAFAEAGDAVFDFEVQLSCAESNGIRIAKMVPFVPYLFIARMLRLLLRIRVRATEEFSGGVGIK